MKMAFAKSMIKRVMPFLLSIAFISSLIPSKVMAASGNYDGTWTNTSKNFTITASSNKAILPAGEYNFSFYDTRLGLIDQKLSLTKDTVMSIKNGGFVQTLYEINYGVNSDRGTGRIKIYGNFTSLYNLNITITYEEGIYDLVDSNYGSFSMHKKGSGEKYINILPDMDSKLTKDLQCLNDVAWNGKKYMIAGRGRILSSTDGKKWSIVYKSDFDHVLYGIVWSGKEFVAVGNNETDQSIWTLKSTDGVKWKEFTQASEGYVSDLAYNGKLYVMTASTAIYTSSNAEQWTKIKNTGDTQWYGNVIYAGKYFATTAFNYQTENAYVYYSKDGKKWSKSSFSSEKAYLRDIVYYNEKFYFIQQSDSTCNLVSTKDFKTFTSKDLTPVFGGNYLYYMETDEKNLIVYFSSSAESNYNGIMSSKDGTKWVKDLELENVMNNIVYLNKKVFVVGYQEVYISK